MSTLENANLKRLDFGFRSCVDPHHIHDILTKDNGF